MNRRSASWMLALGLLALGTGHAGFAQELGPKGQLPARSKPTATAVPILPADSAELLTKLLVTSDADPSSGPAPLTVHFTSEIYEGDEAVNPSFQWDFGDGGRSQQQNPQHTYKRPGKYKVFLRVTDAKKRRGTDEMTIDVEEPEE